MVRLYTIKTYYPVFFNRTTVSYSTLEIHDCTMMRSECEYDKRIILSFFLQ